MNFLAHLWLAGEDEGLRLGAILGDFVRGNIEHSGLSLPTCRGIQLHRFIDQFIDALPETAALREQFPTPFRRYSGIIIDLAFDHHLAHRWHRYSAVSLQQFDREVRVMMGQNEAILPARLKAFMRYADRRGLFASYRDEEEVFFSLKGIGQRLSRPNPLHRVKDIWSAVSPALEQGFKQIFPLVQSGVSNWLLETAAQEA